jgi:hypothetical protein
MNWTLQESMNAVDVCCFSSLPYETEWTAGGVVIALICSAHARSEYDAEYTTVSGMFDETPLMYSMSRSDSTQLMVFRWGSFCFAVE